MGENELGLIRDAENYDIWFEPLTDGINGFVIRDKSGYILQVYSPETR
jgi:hypothetical protein